MMRSLGILSVVIATALSGAAAEEASSPDATSGGPIRTASAYLDAMESGDLAAAAPLFTLESSIFESGGQEGDWQHYREHHLGPEMAELASFGISRGKPETQTSTDGSMAFIAWPIEYRIVLRDETVIESRGTVTFVLVREGGDFRIRHLHWSSRRKRAEG